MLAIGLIIGGVGLLVGMGAVRSIIERTVALFTRDA
jgi:hypothetical protein